MLDSGVVMYKRADFGISQHLRKYSSFFSANRKRPCQGVTYGNIVRQYGKGLFFLAKYDLLRYDELLCYTLLRYTYKCAIKYISRHFDSI